MKVYRFVIWAALAFFGGGCASTPTQSEAEGAGEVALQILAFNDFHGYLETATGWAGTAEGPEGARIEAGGAAYLASWLKAWREEAGASVTVTAGDNIGATPFLSAAFRDEPTIRALSLMGVELAAVGNHEFDQGLDELLRLQHGGCHPEKGCFLPEASTFEGAGFKYLGANVWREDGRAPFPPYEIRQIEGVPVAFVGMTLEGTAQIVSAEKVKGLRFSQEAETLNALLPELRAQGARAVVLLLHEGGVVSGGPNGCDDLQGPITEILPALDPSVKVIISGHSHRAYRCEIDGRLLTSANWAGTMVTEIRLALDRESGEIVGWDAENKVVTRDIAPDPEILALIAEYKVLATAVEAEVVGRITADILSLPDEAGGNPAGYVLADAHLAAAQASAGAQIAFINSGGIRAEFVFDEISAGEAPGEITYGEVFKSQPFQNEIVTMSLSGAQIEQVLESQFYLDGALRDRARLLQPSAGFEYLWDPSRPEGDFIDPATIKLHGEPLDMEGVYRVAVNAFVAYGGGGFAIFTEGEERVVGEPDVETVARYFREQGEVSPPREQRIKKAPPAAGP